MKIIITPDNQKVREIDQTPETLPIFNALLDRIYSGELKMQVLKEDKHFSGMINGQPVFKKNRIKPK